MHCGLRPVQIFKSSGLIRTKNHSECESVSSRLFVKLHVIGKALDQGQFF